MPYFFIKKGRNNYRDDRTNIINIQLTTANTTNGNKRAIFTIRRPKMYGNIKKTDKQEHGCERRRKGSTNRVNIDSAKAKNPKKILEGKMYNEFYEIFRENIKANSLKAHNE
jgi:hypothetical protein